MPTCGDAVMPIKSGKATSFLVIFQKDLVYLLRATITDCSDKLKMQPQVIGQFVLIAALGLSIALAGTCSYYLIASYIGA